MYLSTFEEQVWAAGWNQEAGEEQPAGVLEPQRLPCKGTLASCSVLLGVRGGGEATMLKTAFKLLTLLGCLSVSYFGLLLMYNRTVTPPTQNPSQHGGSPGNDTLVTAPVPRGGVQQVVMTTPAPSVPQVEEEEVERTTTSITSTATPPNVTQPCPDDPPSLVGPIAVEFHLKRTLDEVRRKVGDSLREGGRFQPPECVSKHKVAVVIPFRNRHEHLNHWLFYLHPILMRQQLDYGIYIINQDGDGVFNRAKLMNVGYVEALKEYDYDCFVFSDIDLVPMNDRNLYRCFDSPRHLAVAMDKFNFQLPYNTFFGGVSSLSKDQYLKINGFPNTYWGWGGEDDDIYRRIGFRGMAISRPDLCSVGRRVNHILLV